MNNEEIRTLDLFSGIGGFSLGLERAGPFRTVAFCEQDPFAQRVLRKHWPEVPIYDDVRTIDTDGLGRIDLICGGFPCQPFSTASSGKRKGQTDDRYLWPFMFEIIENLKPTWVLCENVTGIEKLALTQMVSDLESGGYETATLEIPACAVGFSHRRTRLWLLAYADLQSESGCAVNAEMAQLSGDSCDTVGLGKNDGVSRKLDTRQKLQLLGNAVVPQVVEQIGRAILKGWQR
jgi:DNA (cytosine-5)-methyltransferase 1